MIFQGQKSYGKTNWFKIFSVQKVVFLGQTRAYKVDRQEVKNFLKVAQNRLCWKKSNSNINSPKFFSPPKHFFKTHFLFLPALLFLTLMIFFIPTFFNPHFFLILLEEFFPPPFFLPTLFSTFWMIFLPPLFFQLF